MLKQKPDENVFVQLRLRIQVHQQALGVPNEERAYAEQLLANSAAKQAAYIERLSQLKNIQTQYAQTRYRRDSAVRQLFAAFHDPCSDSSSFCLNLLLLRESSYQLLNQLSEFRLLTGYPCDFNFQPVALVNELLTENLFTIREVMMVFQKFNYMTSQSEQQRTLIVQQALGDHPTAQFLFGNEKVFVEFWLKVSKQIVTKQNVKWLSYDSILKLARTEMDQLRSFQEEQQTNAVYGHQFCRIPVLSNNYHQFVFKMGGQRKQAVRTTRDAINLENIADVKARLQINSGAKTVAKSKQGIRRIQQVNSVISSEALKTAQLSFMVEKEGEMVETPKPHTQGYFRRTLSQSEVYEPEHVYKTKVIPQLKEDLLSKFVVQQRPLWANERDLWVKLNHVDGGQSQKPRHGQRTQSQPWQERQSKRAAKKTEDRPKSEQFRVHEIKADKKREEFIELEVLIDQAFKQVSVQTAVHRRRIGAYTLDALAKRAKFEESSVSEMSDFIEPRIEKMAKMDPPEDSAGCVLDTISVTDDSNVQMNVIEFELGELLQVTTHQAIQDVLKVQATTPVLNFLENLIDENQRVPDFIDSVMSNEPRSRASEIIRSVLDESEDADDIICQLLPEQQEISRIYDDLIEEDKDPELEIGRIMADPEIEIANSVAESLLDLVHNLVGDVQDSVQSAMLDNTMNVISEAHSSSADFISEFSHSTMSLLEGLSEESTDQVVHLAFDGDDQAQILGTFTGCAEVQTEPRLSTSK